MSTVSVDPSGPYCVVVVPLSDVPLDRKFVIGQVVVSCQSNIQVGAPVGVAGGAIQFVRDKRYNDETLFIAEVVPNTSKRVGNDPDLFAKFVGLPKSSVSGAIELVENARATLKNCLDELDKVG